MPSPAEMRSIKVDLSFNCAKEADRLPPLDPEADSAFRYARYLEKADGPKNYDEVARYYRIAAAHGHYKANNNLQLLITQELAKSPYPTIEVIALAKQLIVAGIPSGYYAIGHYIEVGYGAKRNPELANRYFRKAADLGNPDAQAYVGELLSPPEVAPEVSRQMRKCAVEQGYGSAGFDLAIDLSGRGRYPEAVEAYQQAAKAGDRLSALSLQEGFKGPPPTDRLNFLGLREDTERASRYGKIVTFLRTNESLNPTLPDIDKIVPLPPAELPPWDGTFEWQRQQDAAVPPQKPSDELINRLAMEKGLDPATGLRVSGFPGDPIPTEKDAPSGNGERLPLGMSMRALEKCPQAGVWQACAPSGYVVVSASRTFRRGETLPLLHVELPRAFAILDTLLGARRMHTDGLWRLISYGDEA